VKPVWLLDIDGVLNALTMSQSRLNAAWDEGEWIHTEATSGTATWGISTARPVVDFLTKVHDSGLVDIRWHSTWSKAAENVAQAVGLPTFDVHDAPEHKERHWHTNDAPGSWWKFPGAWRVVHREKRPLIWTDDDLSYYMTSEQKHRLSVANQPMLLLTPDTYTGLCQTHLDKIQMFVDQHGAEEITV
jgi:hypothetical protein